MKLVGLPSSFVGLVMVLATIAIVPSTVSAAESGTKVIPSGGYFVYEFSYSGTTHLSYQVTVNSGPNVDVIVTDEVGYAQYVGVASTVQYSVTYSKLNTRSASFDNDIEGGHYYLIVDNSVQGSARPNGQSATVTYSFDAQPAGLLTPWTLLLLGIALLMVGIVVVTVVVVKAYRRPKRLPMEPQYPYNAPQTAASAPPSVPPPMETISREPLQRAFCPYCGGRVEASWNACPSCGVKLAQDEQLSSIGKTY